MHGDIDKAGTDQGYTVEAAIPWAAFTKAANHPPKNGDVWRMNFYAMKTQRRRRVVADPRPGELPQGVAVRARDVGGSERGAGGGGGVGAGHGGAGGGGGAGAGRVGGEAADAEAAGDGDAEGAAAAAVGVEARSTSAGPAESEPALAPEATNSAFAAGVVLAL